jgi:hypothetical protein
MSASGHRKRSWSPESWVFPAWKTKGSGRLPQRGCASKERHVSAQGRLPRGFSALGNY